MSSTSTTVTPEHFAYLAQRTRGEDAFLKELKDAAVAAGIPPIWISPEQASFMQILLQAARVRELLEVGTLAGYSAICLARAGARVRTVERSEQHADFAERWVARSDVAEWIDVLRGDAVEVLAGLETHSADAAFLDADKRGYGTYLEQCLRIVRPGGLILVDNAFAFGQLFDETPSDPEVEDVRRFNDLMARTPGLHGIIVPIGDGLWVAVLDHERS